MAAFHRALALEPDNSIAHHQLAQLQLAMGLLENAGTLARAAGGFASALRANPSARKNRVTLYVGSNSDAAPARALSALLLAVPAWSITRFVLVVEPQPRGQLISVLRSPRNAGAVLCGALAATGVVVGAIFERLSPTSCWYALAFAVLARVILFRRRWKFRE